VNNSLVVVVLASGVLYGTPLLYGALGELLAERAVEQRRPVEHAGREHDNDEAVVHQANLTR